MSVICLTSLLCMVHGTPVITLAITPVITLVIVKALPTLIDGIKTVGYEIYHLTWNNEFRACVQ